MFTSKSAGCKNQGLSDLLLHGVSLNPKHAYTTQTSQAVQLRACSCPAEPLGSTHRLAFTPGRTVAMVKAASASSLHYAPLPATSRVPHKPFANRNTPLTSILWPLKSRVFVPGSHNQVAAGDRANSTVARAWFRLFDNHDRRSSWARGQEGFDNQLWGILPKFQPVKQQTSKPRPHYKGVLLGGTGQGKSTLINLMVNFFRAPHELRKRLPAADQLRVAVPTPYLEATEPEGAQAREKDVKDRRPRSIIETVHVSALDDPHLISTSTCYAMTSTHGY